MTATAAATDMRRLKALSENGEPKSDRALTGRLATIRDIGTHADERCVFYADGGITDAAEAWSEVAAQAAYVLERIELGTWAWA